MLVVFFIYVFFSVFKGSKLEHLGSLIVFYTIIATLSLFFLTIYQSIYLSIFLSRLSSNWSITLSLSLKCLCSIYLCNISYQHNLSKSHRIINEMLNTNTQITFIITSLKISFFFNSVKYQIWGIRILISLVLSFTVYTQ